MIIADVCSKLWTWQDFIISKLLNFILFYVFNAYIPQQDSDNVKYDTSKI